MAATTATTAKVFVAQLVTALRSAPRPTPTIDGIDCPRLWVQGVVVSVNKDAGTCAVDDGTGTLQVDLRAFLKNVPKDAGGHPVAGDYVMAIGPLHRGAAPSANASDSVPKMLAHQVVVLNTKQQREAVWFLEVIEYWSTVVRR